MSSGAGLTIHSNLVGEAPERPIDVNEELGEALFNRMVMPLIAPSRGLS